MKTQAEVNAKIGLMLPQAKEHLESPEETRKDSPSEPPGGMACANPLISDFWLPKLEIIHFTCFSCPVTGICLAAPGSHVPVFSVSFLTSLLL